MRQIQQPVTLKANPHGVPLELRRDGQLHVFTYVIDTWQWAGNWVTGIPERTYWLVGSDQGSTFEFYREATGQWWLSAVQD